MKDFSQGLSNKRDRYEELIAKGIDPGTAEAQANSEMNQYLAENLSMDDYRFFYICSYCK